MMNTRKYRKIQYSEHVILLKEWAENNNIVYTTALHRWKFHFKDRDTIDEKTANILKQSLMKEKKHV
jgi:hypothetical protein